MAVLLQPQALAQHLLHGIAHRVVVAAGDRFDLGPCQPQTVLEGIRGIQHRRQRLLAAAAAQMEAARIEANKQVRYLSLSVAPVAPDEATYPKAFQNTLVAFLIFSGIYLMLSLTASILREQVST